MIHPRAHKRRPSGIGHRRPGGIGAIVTMKMARVNRELDPFITRRDITAAEQTASGPRPSSAAEQEADAERRDLELSKPPIDGFSMASGLRYLPGRYYAQALSDFDDLRRDADKYRCRMVSVPRDNLVTIPFNQALEFQAKVPAGSWFWGYTFAAITGTIADFRVDLMFNCGDRPLWSQTILAAALRPSGVSGLHPVLVKPVLMEGEAQMNVRISNMDAANDRRGQLLLMFADPCLMIETRVDDILI